jgi:vitamin B12 transporter
MFNFGGNFSFAEKSNVATTLRAPKQRANAYLEVLPFKNNRINFSYQYVAKEAMHITTAALFLQKMLS